MKPSALFMQSMVVCFGIAVVAPASRAQVGYDSPKGRVEVLGL